MLILFTGILLFTLAKRADTKSLFYILIVLDSWAVFPFSVKGILEGESNVRSVKEAVYSCHIQHPFYHKTWAKRHTDHKQKKRFQLKDFYIVEYQLKRQPPTSIWNKLQIQHSCCNSWGFRIVKSKHFPVPFLRKSPPSVKKSFLLMCFEMITKNSCGSAASYVS